VTEASVRIVAAVSAEARVISSGLKYNISEPLTRCTELLKSKSWVENDLEKG